MARIELRAVGDDGELSDVLAVADNAGSAVAYDDSRMGRTLASVVRGTADAVRCDEIDAVDRLAVDGWSNGKLTIGREGGFG